MTCCSEQICIGGRTYDANFLKRPDGSIVSGTYVDENFNNQAVPQGGFTFGVCQNGKPHTLTLTGVALNAGANVITHNLGLPAPFRADVQAREPLPSGSEVSVKVTAYTANTFTIFSSLQTPITVDLFITGKDI